MDTDVGLILDGGLYGADSLCVLLLDGEDTLGGVGHLHAVFYTADGLLGLLLKLLDVVLETGFALGCVYQNVTAFQVCAQLYAGGEACAAHADDTGFFNHVQLVFGLLNGDVLIGLFGIGLDDDRILGNFFYYAVYGGEDVGTKAGGGGDQSALFYLIASLDDRSTGRAYVLPEQKFDVPHDTHPFHC